MAEYGEWNRKGAVLSDVTAQKEYGITREFIVEGIEPVQANRCLHPVILSTDHDGHPISTLV